MPLGPSDRRRLAKLQAAAERYRRTSYLARPHDLSRLDAIDLADYHLWQQRREAFHAAHPGAALWEAILNGADYPELNPSIARLI